MVVAPRRKRGESTEGTGMANTTVRLRAAEKIGPADDAFRKVAWRLIPFTMNKDLGISATAYGNAAGIFFLGYFLFEVPSNIML